MIITCTERPEESETMASVFVDTVAWIALVNINDALHNQALQVMEALRQQNAHLITTEFVLLEVADALSAPSIRSQTLAFVEGLRQLPILLIVPATQALLADGWILYGQRSDKDWGLTDCTSFVIMIEEQITQAFTSDHHFEQAGFANLLSLGG
jgi:predicted nucleic acid-binding protein